ncbi:MAG: bifunctional lysylphosphatidylglycerol synthetase/lysine--tRNA ligase LysX, partial [Gordonia sp. (in: high G+C Gram-positive bacteria)]
MTRRPQAPVDLISREVDRQTVATRRAHASIEQIARPAGRGRWVPQLAGTVVGLMATVAFLSAMIPPFRRLVETPRSYVDDYLFPLPGTSLSWAVVLGLLAVALAWRKRIAWVIVVAYLVFSASVDLVIVLAAHRPAHPRYHHTHAAIGLVVDVVLLTILLLSYRQFYTRVRRGAPLTALGVLIGGLAVGVGLGWLLVTLVPGELKSNERLPYVFNHVVAYSSIDLKVFDGHHTHAPVNWVLGLFGAIALIAAAVVLLRSQRIDAMITHDDERLIRALLTAYGDDSLGYFSTRRDKAVVFAPDGRAAITYRTEMGCAVVGGDPVGDRASWPEVIADFLLLCEVYGWHPAVLGASEAGAREYAAAGLRVFNIGDEAILNTADLSLSGPQMKSVRASVTKVRRLGVTSRIRRMAELTPAEAAEVDARAAAWRDTDEERGFAMALGRVGDPADGQCLLVEAVENEGGPNERVIGMLSFAPWGRNGVSLDLMRRDRNGPNGVVEFMVGELATKAEKVGVARVSLNFAVFREFFEQGDRIGIGPVTHAVHGVLRFSSKFFQVESLYRANAKYLPIWVPRFVCFSDPREIPRIGMAIMVAEGFVRFPGDGRRRRHYKYGESSIPAGIDLDVLVASLERSAQDSEIAPVHRSEQVRVRLEKLERLTAAGVDAYPVAERPTHSVAEAREAGPEELVRIAGRITRIRDFGKVTFADLHDWTGEIQLLVQDSTSNDAGLDFAATLDLGDLVEVTGRLGASRTGETSLMVENWRLTAKCLHPLPDKRHGLVDPEARVRQRYLDLAVNPRSRELLVTRSAVVQALRGRLIDEGYLEVETPILQQVHGGANAAPFQTHIKAYHLDLSLRIAPELYLKRLCVGGVEKVFEIGRNFRNEGVDATHNPEFTSLEAYGAHQDYLTMMDLTRELIVAAATAANGTPVVDRTGDDGQTERVDISGPWPVKAVHEAISEAAGVSITPDTPECELRTLCAERGIELRHDWDAGQIVGELYEELVEPFTTFPTFYKDFPTSTSPLTRQHRVDPRLAERWDLVAWGMELGTAYSELTDPLEQRRRLTEQSLRASGYDPEAMSLDEDFLTALEYGMPPTGG